MWNHLGFGRFCSIWNLFARSKHVSSQVQINMYVSSQSRFVVTFASNQKHSWQFRHFNDTSRRAYSTGGVQKHQVRPGQPRFWKTWAKASASALPSFPAACPRRDGHCGSHLEAVEFPKWRSSHKSDQPSMNDEKHKPMEAWLGPYMSQSPANLTIPQVFAFGSTESTLSPITSNRLAP